MLLEAGAAFKINDLPLLPRRIDAALGDGAAKAKAMAESIRGLGMPDAAATIVDAIVARQIQPIYAAKAKQP